MKKRNYEVQVTARATVVVIGATSEKEACAFARDELDMTTFSDVDMECGEIADEKDLETFRRHADAVSEER